MGRANRTDVARLAGVSTAVVSYVMNDGPRPVAKATRERVIAAMEVLRYRPNNSARALKLARTNVLGLLTRDITDPHLAEFAKHLQSLADAKGYALMIANTGHDGAHETAQLHSMLAREVDGIVISGRRYNETLKTLLASGVKKVSVEWQSRNLVIPSVAIDDYEATMQGLEHLVGHGHAEIGFLGGKHDLTMRYQAWLDTMRPLVSHDRTTHLAEWGDCTRQGGYAAAKRLFYRGNRPSGLFVSSEVQAVGALKAIYELGLRVPDDVAIISFGGTAAAFTSPALTAIEIPLDSLALHCMRILTTSESPGDFQTTLHHRLHIRESCGCLSRKDHQF